MARYVLFALCVVVSAPGEALTPAEAGSKTNPAAQAADRSAPSRGTGKTSTVDRHSTVPPPAVGLDAAATTDELIKSAREMFLADDYASAKMLYQSVLIREPNHLSAMLELAIVYEKTGELQYAKGLLTRASILKPYDQQIIDRNNEIARKLANTLEAEVDSLLAAHAYRSALPKLSVLLTTQPENADLHFKKAQSHLKLGDSRSALNEIEKALRLSKDQRFFDLRTRLLTLERDAKTGALAREAGELMATGRDEDEERALRLVSQILELDPDHEWAKQHFLALTTGDEAPEPPKTTQSRWSRIRVSLDNSARTAAGAAVTFFHLMNRHLDVLFHALIVLVIFASPLTFMIIRGFAPRQSLSGRLSQFDIREVLTMIQTQNRTGVLKIKSKSAKGRVFFDSGDVYHCKSGGLEGREALRHFIEAAKDGYFVFINSTRSPRKTIDVPLSLILMDLPERNEANVAKGLPKRQPAPTKKQSRMRELLNNKV